MMSPVAMMRQTAYMQTDIKIHELNNRLHMRPEDAEKAWWDHFANDFFEDDAVLSFSYFEDGLPKHYNLRRVLIPRFFCSVFEGGAKELYFILKHPTESFLPSGLSMECENALMVTQYNQPSFARVVAEGKLSVECSYDEMSRIRRWHLQLGRHREFIPRDIVAVHVQDPASIEMLSRNITQLGVNAQTLNFLRVSSILDPMQDLMSRQKATGLPPRECLKTALFQRWQCMVPHQTGPTNSSSQMAPPIINTKPQRQPKKTKRGRKGSAAGTKESPTKAAKHQNTVTPTCPPASQPISTDTNVGQDVMIVGEPVLMGGELGDNDERLITRLENNADTEPPPSKNKNEAVQSPVIETGDRDDKTTTEGPASEKQSPVLAKNETISPSSNRDSQ